MCLRNWTRWFAALVIPLAVSGLCYGQTVFVWTNSTTDSNWSTVGNWTNGAAPLAGGSNDYSLTFAGTTNYTANNDLAGTFVLNELVLNTTTYVTNLSSYVTGGDLQFATSSAAVTPVIRANGSKNFVISNNVSLANNLLLTGTGAGSITLAGVLSGAVSVIKSNSSVFNYATNTAPTHTTTEIDGGTVQWTYTGANNTTNSFGTGAITINGGTFGYRASGAGNLTALTNNFIVNNTGTIAHESSTGKSFVFTGTMALNGQVTFGNVYAGGGGTPGGIYAGNITIDQSTAALRMLTLMSGGNHGPTVTGNIVDGAGGAGNILYIRSGESQNGRAVTIAGTANTWASGTIITNPVSGSQRVVVQTNSVLGTSFVLINGGSLEFRSEANLDASQSIITNNASFVYGYQSGITTSRIVFAGSGTLVMDGPSGVVLTNASSLSAGTRIQSGLIDVSGVSVLSTGNVNLIGGALALDGTGGSSKTWTNFVDNRTGGYGTGANQWQFGSGTGALAARNNELRIDGYGTTASTFDRDFGLGSTVRSPDGSFYANASINISRATTLTARRKISIAPTGPGLAKSGSAGVVEKISGNITDDGVTRGTLKISGTALTANAGEVPELVLSGASTWTGSAYLNVGRAVNTGKGGMVVTSDGNNGQGAFVRFASNAALPSGNAGGTAYLAAINKGNNGNYSYNNGFLLGGTAGGETYTLPTGMSFLIGSVNSGASDNQDSTLGVTGGKAVLNNADVFHHVAITGDAGGFGIGLLTRDDSVLTLGGAAGSVRFRPSTSTDNTDNGISGAATTLADASLSRLLIKRGTGTLILSNVQYLAATSATDASGQYIWYLGCRGLNNPDPAGAFGGAVRELSGTDPSQNLSAVSNVVMRGGVLEFAATPRSISLGTGGGQINMRGGTGGGFAAAGGARSFTLGSANPGGQLIWADNSNGATFLNAGEGLIFGSLTADNTLTLANSINLVGVGGSQVRTIYTVRGTGTVPEGEISGTISGAGSAGLIIAAMTRPDGSILPAGTLVLSGTNTYAGATTVSNGTLLVTGVLSNSSGLVTVVTNATLGGTGVINRPVTINAGGILAPGASVGTLTVSNLTLNAACVLNYELGTNRDLTVVNGSLALGGTLNVADAGGFTTTNYTLITYTGGAPAGTITVGTTPNPSYTYSIDTTSTVGQVILQVTGTGPTAPVASFSASPLTGVEPLQVIFTNTSTGTQTSWAWDFDNNGSTDSTAQNPTNTYAAGIYSVKLIACNGSACNTNTQTSYISVLNAQQSWQNHYGVTADSSDADGDGLSNLAEFQAGFDPTNNAAYAHIISTTKSGDNIVITYLGSNGDTNYAGGPVTRTNVVEFATGMANGSYTNDFTGTVQTDILSNGVGLGTSVTATDNGGATNTPARYYRVRVLAP